MSILFIDSIHQISTNIKVRKTISSNKDSNPSYKAYKVTPKIGKYYYSKKEDLTILASKKQ